MTKRFTVSRIFLTRDGYTSSGRYYGTGAPLFSVLDNETGQEREVRGSDAKAARQKVMNGIFGAPPKNAYLGEARKLSTAITEEMNKEPTYKDWALVQKYREKLNALTRTLRPLTPADPAWESYDKHMDQAAHYESGRHTSYALSALRAATQMIAGAADRLKT